MKNPKVGDFVYTPYQPQVPGMIMKVYDPSRKVLRPGNWDRACFDDMDVLVYWIDGRVSSCDSFHLSSLTALIDTTRRRLENHEGRLKTLKAHITKEE